jgi:hypothetical protein
MVHLSTSDWVAIAIGTVQLLVSVLIAVWSVRRSAPINAEPASTSPVERWSFLRTWFRSSWLFMLFFCYAFYEVWALASGPEDLSKSLILRIVLYTAYGVLNAVASVVLFVVQFQFDMMGRIVDVLREMNRAHGDAAETQTKHLAITERLIAAHKPNRRRGK